MKKRKNIGKVAYVCAILILVLVMIFSGLQILESTVLSKGQNVTDGYVSKTITRDGVEYFPRKDITVMMVLGLDRYGEMKASDTFRNDGTADLVSLVIFDETNQSCSVLCLNRDTMVKMPVLGLGGKPAGSTFAQLTMSYTYGSGLQDSCENTKKTVSDFLYGLNIDYYVAMNMDAIGILNDAVDGVTVEVTDDFSAIDSSIPMGQVTLRGEQAIRYVRTRKGLGDQLNLTRMGRHREYMKGFVTALREKLQQNENFAAAAYEDVSPYIVTDCSVKVLSSMLQRYSGYELVETISPAGQNVRGEEYYEFYVDEQKLDELILRLFYAPKK